MALRLLLSVHRSFHGEINRHILSLHDTLRSNSGLVADRASAGRWAVRRMTHLTYPLLKNGLRDRVGVLAYMVLLQQALLLRLTGTLPTMKRKDKTNEGKKMSKNSGNLNMMISPQIPNTTNKITLTIITIVLTTSCVSRGMVTASE